VWYTRSFIECFPSRGAKSALQEPSSTISTYISMNDVVRRASIGSAAQRSAGKQVTSGSEARTGHRRRLLKALTR
jgi:hypothetical protein